MKRGLIVLFVIISLLTGCSAQERSTQEYGSAPIDYKKITAQEVKTVIDDGNTVILDVRTKPEYEEGHLEGATLLPNTEIKEKAAEALPDKSAKILIYCRTGNRSAQAAKELLALGYTNVYDFGGINNWPYETVK